MAEFITVSDLQYLILSTEEVITVSDDGKFWLTRRTAYEHTIQWYAVLLDPKSSSGKEYLFSTLREAVTFWNGAVSVGK